MPMIDVYATTGTFASPHQLAQDLAKALDALQRAQARGATEVTSIVRIA